MATHILVSTRTDKSRAEKLKSHIEGFGMISAKVVKNNDKYEVWAKPSKIGKIYVGSLKSKTFGSYLKIVQYGHDGEVI